MTRIEKTRWWMVPALALSGLLALALVNGGTAQANTLENVKKRGFLKCGVAQQLPGFAYADNQGRFQGFDVDFCRGLAAAVGVDVKFTPLNAKERFPALQSGEVDVLFRNTTWTLSRDVSLGFDFAAINYYDGQGFMVRKKLGVSSAKELNGATVCLNSGTTTELNLADYFRANGMKYKSVLYEKSEEVRMGYEAGRCDVYTTDGSGLAAQRSAMKNPGAHKILPEIISKEPLGPAVRHGDNRWGDVVRWSFNVTVGAEEKGITAAGVEAAARQTTDPEVKRMLGVTGSLGADLGLQANWALRTIKAVGNYGEIFERNLGKNTPLALDRGLNQLWFKGGLMYAPPIR
ncbi:MAG: amino acid ABC transporter substrate-binding protein [bacterium]